MNYESLGAHKPSKSLIPFSFMFVTIKVRSDVASLRLSLFCSLEDLWERWFVWVVVGFGCEVFAWSLLSVGS
jgi:hypothetical protein